MLSIFSKFAVFVVYGMAEIILCELFDISYIAFQSDSITKTLQNHKQWTEEIKPKLQDKYLILLLDNDISCKSTIEPLKEETPSPENIIIFEMIDLLQTKVFLNDRKKIVSNSSKEVWKKHHQKILEQGYDFKDFCNSVADVEKIENILKKTIKAKI